VKKTHILNRPDQTQLRESLSSVQQEGSGHKGQE
jgi:hypothetical protein